ncbi:MAG: efflux RND transporter periplasmic adaptor subunit [Candidatus Moranbacteria bacterium]|nr:efflux RND transporter periplasmic adaptor subunit [Candidatus Moranbacteria bacterium]
MFRKRNIILVLIISASALAWWYFRVKNTGEAVQTEIVRRGDVAETVSVTGELVPETYADLSFASAGIIDAALVKAGDVVIEGQVIVSLDREVISSQLKDARLAARIAEQNEQLILRDRLSYAPEERAAKKLASAQAREKVHTIEAEMAASVLRTPFAGEVSRFDARVGEGVTLGKVMARVIKPGAYLLESRVPESDIAKIKLGMTAKITFDALTQDDIFEGEVVTIDPASTVVQDVVSYTVQFRLKLGDERLKEGMTGNIDIETDKRTGVLWVPYRALTKEGTKTYAEMKRGEQGFEKVVVTTGLEGDEGTVEITSGLTEGDAVTIGATQKK